ncbi:hypothetical protein SELMODRAFT_408170 [Selaginella moellendorffii]|uniref:Uncharacterized protein n=1 Tax=Selaginella moellendorffii TaxID=88036 RepID=D8R7F1_SELML|nr:hypothetical protein SELMODRAFT_408170 [Selaginella moellendorffii]
MILQKFEDVWPAVDIDQNLDHLDRTPKPGFPRKMLKSEAVGQPSNSSRIHIKIHIHVKKHLSWLFHSVTYYFVESWGTRLTRGFVVANSEMNAAKKPPACMLISAVERKCFDLEPVAAEEQQLPCCAESLKL